MKDRPLNDILPMDLLELPRNTQHRQFYLSSCESGAGIGTHDSNISSRHSSMSSNSSLNVSLPPPSISLSSTIQTNLFLNVLKRLHNLKLRRKKHGRYRSHSTSLHLFFKKHPSSSIDVSQSKIDFCKSPSSPILPTIRTDIENATLSNNNNHSCQQLNQTGANRTRTNNSKKCDFQMRRSFLQLIRSSDKTVSEDNNTNTLSSVDLTLTPHVITPVLVTESNSSVTPVQQVTTFDMKSVSALFFIFVFTLLTYTLLLDFYLFVLLTKTKSCRDIYNVYSNV